MTKPPRASNTGKQSVATAPYNFVPLPKKVFPAPGDLWNQHDVFDEDAHSGWVDLDIKTLTPLFIRGPVVQENGEWGHKDSRLRPEPFKTPDGRPVIPGSSLRGLLRTLVEILSFSRIQPVTDERPFFRDMSKGRLAEEYRSRMVRGGKKPSGGFVKKYGDVWVIVPAKEVLRVDHFRLKKLSLGIPNKPDPCYYPKWKGQHKDCWFKRDKDNKVKFIDLSDAPDLEKGTLVLSGSAPKKKAEFIFCGQNVENPIQIPRDKLERFHSHEQITPWQESAYPKHKPLTNCRKDDGHLRDGEPVFFLCDEKRKTDDNPEGLLFFGRAQMFRFPYDLSPVDLIPPEIKGEGIDLAEVVFGRVSQDKEDKRPAIKSRVLVEDAVAAGEGDDWFEEVIVPHILSSPKVTCFPHYLWQPGAVGTYTYLESDLQQTNIRGHKLYWHRWDRDRHLGNVKIEAAEDEQGRRSHEEVRQALMGPNVNNRHKQHTVMRPVKAGVVFIGRIRFENLTDLELGALLAALNLPEGCAHKLGMGKPLGLGSLKIDAKLNLINPDDRYGSWDNHGVFAGDSAAFIGEFESAMIAYAKASAETVTNGRTGLRRIARLEALFQILQWERRPDPSKTGSMGVNDFRSKPVLPSPCHVASQSETPQDDKTPYAGDPRPEKVQLQSAPGPKSERPAKQAKRFNAIQKGQTLEGLLKQSDQKWVARFDGDDRDAVIENPRKIPDGTKAGAKAEFYILLQSKKRGIKARFQKLL